MLNFQPELTDRRGLQVNQHAIERHVNYDHYVRDFTPDQFSIAGVSARAIVPVATPFWSAITMPVAANSIAAVTWGRPSEWRTGLLRVKFRFTSPVGSTNTFQLQVAVNGSKLGDVLPATALYAATANYAGPAVANTRMTTGFVYTTTPFGSDIDLFTLRIVRIVPDANVNDFDLLHAMVEHIPAQAVAQ